MNYFGNRRFLSIGLVKTVLFVFFVAQFQIAPTNAAKTYTACANKKTGVIRLLNKGNCNSKTEKKISWNSVGPQGVAGIAGAVGANGPAGVNGKDGVDGKNGLDGKNGADGKTGNTILYGTSNPTATTGVAGDFYINTSTNVIFGPKTTTWPVGTSLVGPTGPGGVGPIGPQGPAGVTGASTQMLWFTPRDLESTQPASINDTSTTVSLTYTTNPPYFFEALELKPGKQRMVNRAVPKGWSNYKSLTMRIYWMSTESSTSNVRFEIYMNFLRDGSDLSTTTGRELWAAPLVDDVMSKPPRDANVVNVTTFNPSSRQFPSSAKMQEGDLLTFSLTRTGLFNGFPNLYAGNVYVLGVAVQANFD